MVQQGSAAVNGRDYINEWTEAWNACRWSKGSVALANSAAATGEYERDLGPRQHFARVVIAAEPAEAFIPSFDLSSRRVEELQAQGALLDEIVFGLLDVLMTSNAYPIFGMKIRITDVDFDPLRAAPIAFRMAGRDAARRILKATGQDWWARSTKD